MPLLEHSLSEGYIHNWLIAGPATLPVDGFGALQGDLTSRKQQILSAFLSAKANFPLDPMEREHFDLDGQTVTWRYARCYEDHLVQANIFCPVWQKVVSWVYAGIRSKSAGSVAFELTSRGCAEVWLNGKLVYQQSVYSDALQTGVFQVELGKENGIWVRLMTVGGGEAQSHLALRLLAPSTEHVDQFTVLTPVKAKFPHRIKKFEETLDKAYLQETVSYRGTHINLFWTPQATEELTYAYHVQDEQERNYVEGSMQVEANTTVDVGHPQRIFERPLQVVLRGSGKEYYEQDMRYQHSLPVYALDNAYSSVPMKDYGNRRIEALQDAARREPALFAEIAKMGLGQWENIEQKGILAAVERVNRLEVGSVLELVGLLGMLKRFGEAAEFPHGLKADIETTVLQYRYGKPEPGDDAMNFEGESEAVLFAAAGVLAGQMYPAKTFTRSGLSGSQLRERAEAQAMGWMRDRGMNGFTDWDSNLTFEWNFVALTHLAGLAENQALVDLAVAVMDKLLFLMAVNSIRGVNGTTHGRTGAAMIKSSQLDGLSGPSYLLWGMGTLNARIAGTVSLVLAEYEYPAFFAEIAEANEPELISRERHAAAQADGGAFEVNKYLYRTPDYLLASAQNFRPGEEGRGEHIWQATLGTEAVVFTNHPGSMSEDEACLAGFWRGNGRLPRTAQWKDTLIAVYNLPEEEWLNFTHAYFPVPAFDESLIEGGWAMARKGGAYLAITSSQGFEWIAHAPDTYRELRAQGSKCTWVCLMGRQAVDGSFDDFKNKVLRLRPEWRPLGVKMTNLRGENLSFGWEDPLEVDGRAQVLSGFKHIENPYTTVEASQAMMDIAWGEILMRLNFE